MENHGNHAPQGRRRRRRSRRRAPHGLLALCLGLLFCLGAMRMPRDTGPRHWWGTVDRRMAAEAVETTGTAAPGSGGKSGAEERKWHLILVNRWNPIPEDYQVDLMALENGERVDGRIFSPLEELLDAAREDGVYPVVVSGYRSGQTQQKLLDQKTADYKADGYGEEEAARKAQAWVAAPGTSEHQLGIAVDINGDGIRSTGDEVYQWLGQNSYRFGFVRRYPADKTEITGVIHEPWHYRYVGVEAAAQMWSRGICLEEYLGEAAGTRGAQ